MSDHFVLIGAEESPYSMKVRAYLGYKGLPFHWQNRWQAAELFQRHARLPLIPLLVTPDDRGLQIPPPCSKRWRRSTRNPPSRPRIRAAPSSRRCSRNSPTSGCFTTAGHGKRTRSPAPSVLPRCRPPLPTPQKYHARSLAALRARYAAAASEPAVAGLMAECGCAPWLDD